MENNKLSIIQKEGICLVLSGGGFRGAFHIGVLAFLDENNVKIEAISGTSIGAIIGCSYASGVKPKEILEIFESKEFKKMISFNLSFKSLFKINLNPNIVKKLFLHERLEELAIPTFVSYSSLTDSDIIYTNHGNITSEILKSSSLFPIFETIDENNKIYADGGIFDNLPLEPIKKYNKKILSVNLHPNINSKLPTFFSKIKRSLFLLWYASIKESVKESDFYITDEKLSKFNILNQKKNMELFELGYKSAKRDLCS